jgi:hypothetical protein
MIMDEPSISCKMLKSFSLDEAIVNAITKLLQTNGDELAKFPYSMGYKSHHYL